MVWVNNDNIKFLEDRKYKTEKKSIKGEVEGINSKALIAQFYLGSY